MPKDLSKLFCPKSLAIIGASRDKSKVGAIVLRNVIESKFSGEIYPVNPNTDKIGDLECYKNIDDLPQNPDLAVIALPADKVHTTVQQLSAKKIRNIVIFAAGYRETGGEGAKLESDLLKLATDNDLNILGPNCLGFINNSCNLNATFGQNINTKGKIKFISQSGAIAASIFDWSHAIGLGFSEFVTLGNKTIIDENDILHYFEQASTTEGDSADWAIGMYLESVTHGEEFYNHIQKLAKKHPIFVIKPGHSKDAAHAMKSHTGSMAGEDDVFQCAMDQAGAIRCDTLEDFFDLAKAFAWGKLPEGPNLAVVSNAGGPAVISADSINDHGLTLAKFEDKTKKQLEDVLPRSASILDPIDLLGDALAERYGAAAEILVAKTDLNSILFILTPQVMTQIGKTAEYISYLSEKHKMPIFCSFIGGSLVAEGEKILNANNIPSFRFPERAIYSISKMWQYTQNRARLMQGKKDFEGVTLPQESTEVRPIVQKAVNEKFHSLDNIAADTLVKSIGIKTPPTKIICDYEEALEFVKEHSYPVVLKVSGNDFLHKKQLGAVITGITTDAILDDAMHKIERKLEQLPKDSIKNPQIQIQKGILGGIEVIVGLKVDETFGPVVMFGAGGSLVELISDKNLHLLPMGIEDAKDLVSRSKIARLLIGVSNEYALEKLYDLIVRVGKLARVIPEATEIEINPVILTSTDAWAVDTKVVMKQSVLPPQAKKTSAGPKFKIAHTLEHINLATKFNHYKFESDEPLDFEPGQYISVKVADTAIRAYSLATRYDNKHFDLLVDTRPGGPGSMYFENLKPGDKMEYLGPFGKFVFNPNDGAENLLFLATGSGASAVRCMIDCALQESGFTKKMKLYFGLTYREEIFWKDHFDELSKKYPNFSYEIALFKPDEKWKGASGYITDLVKKDFPDASTCSAYLCGHRAMISDACDILSAKGCPQDRIYTERFV